jgi:hypothetical protein
LDGNRAATLFIHGGWKTDLIGFVLMGVVALNQIIGRRRLKEGAEMILS